MRSVPLALLVALLALGCQAEPAPEGGAEPVPSPEPMPEESGPAVVATVYPLAWLADAIDPRATVTLLTADGQDPHDLELSPGDRALVETADVVLYVGDIDFQPQVERAVMHATGAVVALAEAAGAQRLREDEHAHDHGEDEDEGVDPHLWFDARIMADAAIMVADALAAADPDRATELEQAGRAVRDRLADLAAELDALLADCARDTVIVSHEAYGYLLGPHGLHQEGISGAAGHAEASPQRLATLSERIRSEAIPAVLAEPVEGRADAEALAAEADVELREIDPLELPPPGGADFPDALRAQAQTFAAALECS